MSIATSLLRSEATHIRNCKTVSIFWVTEFQTRAERIDFLSKKGVVKRVMDKKKYPFPYCHFIFNEVSYNLLLQEIKVKNNFIPKRIRKSDLLST